MIKITFESIAGRLAESDIPSSDLVIGISQGGTIPAALVAYSLCVPLQLIRVKFRDSGNKPVFKQPEVGYVPDLPKDVKSVLLVDDVSVTGATLAAARRYYMGVKTTTMVLKGKADYVLFPEINDCVEWPWNNLREL